MVQYEDDGRDQLAAALWGRAWRTAMNYKPPKHFRFTVKSPAEWEAAVKGRSFQHIVRPEQVRLIQPTPELVTDLSTADIAKFTKLRPA